MAVNIKVLAAAAVLGACSLASCDTVIDDRIPDTACNIVFTTQGMWDVYGVTGAYQWRNFIYTSQDRIPVQFPYNITSHTGYGGVLLVGDMHGVPRAYDLACPVECKPTVRVIIDTDHMDAYCPVCHSTYDVFNNNGTPTSGPAWDYGYGLRRYQVGHGANAYMLIAR